MVAFPLKGDKYSGEVISMLWLVDLATFEGPLNVVPNDSSEERWGNGEVEVKCYTLLGLH